jgi:hypothetical protein
MTSCNDRIDQSEVKGEFLTYFYVTDRPFQKSNLLIAVLHNDDQVSVIIDDRVGR